MISYPAALPLGNTVTVYRLAITWPRYRKATFTQMHLTSPNGFDYVIMINSVLGEGIFSTELILHTLLCNFNTRKKYNKIQQTQATTKTKGIK